MEKRRIAELVIPYSVIGKRLLPAGISIVGVLPQKGLHVVNESVAFIIEGDMLEPHYGGWAALTRFTMNSLYEFLQNKAA